MKKRNNVLIGWMGILIFLSFQNAKASDPQGIQSKSLQNLINSSSAPNVPATVPQGVESALLVPEELPTSVSNDLQIRFRLSCYGTNLRSHPNPLGPKDTIEARVGLPGREPIWLRFPAMLVMALSDETVLKQFREYYDQYDKIRRDARFSANQRIRTIQQLIEEVPNCGDEELGHLLSIRTETLNSMLNFAKRRKEDIREAREEFRVAQESNQNTSNIRIPDEPSCTNGSLESSLNSGISASYSSFRHIKPMGGFEAAWGPWVVPGAQYDQSRLWIVFWHKLTKGSVVRDPTGNINDEAMVKAKDASFNELAEEFEKTYKVADEWQSMYDLVYGPEPIQPPLFSSEEYEKFFQGMADKVVVAPENKNTISDTVLGPRPEDMVQGSCAILPNSYGKCAVRHATSYSYNSPTSNCVPGAQGCSNPPGWRIWTPIIARTDDNPGCCAYSQVSPEFYSEKNDLLLSRRDGAANSSGAVTATFKQGILLLGIKNGLIKGPDPYNSRDHLKMIPQPFFRKMAAPPPINYNWALNTSFKKLPDDFHTAEKNRVFSSIQNEYYGARMRINKSGNALFIDYALPGRAGFCLGYYSPLMLFFDDKRPSFTAKSNFSLNPDSSQVYWPEAKSSGWFLALDRNGNSKIDNGSELFGENAKEGGRNGFEALKEFDSNADMRINSKDKDFAKLVLWNDQDGDGVSQKTEIKSLSQMGVEEISLKYSAKQITSLGNRAELRERASFRFKNAQGQTKSGEVIDVWFKSVDGGWSVVKK